MRPCNRCGVPPGSAFPGELRSRPLPVTYPSHSVLAPGFSQRLQSCAPHERFGPLSLSRSGARLRPLRWRCTHARRRYTMTTLDPYVNMLRTTTEALAGAIGGCDSMHAGFFDQGLRMPDDFSRRIARNTQVLLQAESHVHRVIDPAGGSWYVEQLTDEIAARAWTLFQEIEQPGPPRRGTRRRALSNA